MNSGARTEHAAEGSAGEGDEQARVRLHGRDARDAGFQEDVCRNKGSCKGRNWACVNVNSL